MIEIMIEEYVDRLKGKLYMDQDPRLVLFIETALSLLERMLQTPTVVGYESMKQDVHTFSVHLLEAKDLLIQGEQISPMRADVRDLIVQIKKGILAFLRFFEIHGSEEYKAFRAAKVEVDEFLTDPRVTEFMKRSLGCVEYLLRLPDTNAIQTQLHDLHASLVNQQNMLKYNPERAYEESFATSVEATTNGLAKIAWQLPDFATSEVYKQFCETALQAGFFLVGLPSVPQSELEV
jgi:hypothetical protein